MNFVKFFFNLFGCTDHEVGVSAPAYEATVSKSVPQAPWTCCTSDIPPAASVPLRSNEDACADLQFGQAGAFKETYDWLK